MILTNILKKLNKVEKLGKILDFFCKYGITKSELDRLHDVTEGEEFGIISADRTELSNNKNKQRRTALVKFCRLKLGVYTRSMASGYWNEKI